MTPTSRQRRALLAGAGRLARPKDGGKWGAPHGIDLPLAFDNTHDPEAVTGNAAPARHMAAVVSETFIAFAKTGVPQNASIPHWPPYRLDSRATLLFDSHTRVVKDPRGDERRLFRERPIRRARDLSRTDPRRRPKRARIFLSAHGIGRDARELPQ